MADTKTKCKICRRTGQKLFLKEEKCFSPKCPITRKPYPPGKRAKRPRPLSEFGSQLKEKQKLKFLYGLREKQFSNYVKSAMDKGGANISSHVIELLESRLDNTIFRLGFTQSRSNARQLVSHGHIYINNKRTTIPSFQIKKEDKISIKTTSLSKKVFADLDIELKKYNPPSWLKLDKEKKVGEVTKLPVAKEAETGVDIGLIIDFYSR